MVRVAIIMVRVAIIPFYHFIIVIGNFVICGRILPCFEEMGLPDEQCEDKFFGSWDCYALVKN